MTSSILQLSNVHILSKISSDIELVLSTYRKCKEHNVALLTAVDGKKAMEVLEEALVKWKKD